MICDEVKYIIYMIYNTLFEMYGPFDDYYSTKKDYFFCQSVLLWTADELVNRVSHSWNTVYNEEETIAIFIEEMEEYINIAKSYKVKRMFTIAYEFANDILWRLVE